jgi:anaphase-promoting complex subunit 6
MEKFLREWRKDAFNKAQYESAVFIGDKLLALTSPFPQSVGPLRSHFDSNGLTQLMFCFPDDDSDAFFLAQVHFASGNYSRAQAILSKQDLVTRNPSCRYLSGHCLIKQSRFEEALGVLGERNATHLVHNAAKRKAPGKAARTGGLGGGGPSAAAGKASLHPAATGRMAEVVTSAADEEEATANRRYEASMCYLRGICYAKQNAFDRAKECYKDAVRIDIQCFEAFDQLMRNALMSPEEEHEFLESLDFGALRGLGENADMPDEPSDYVHMLYYTRLSKYQDPAAFHTAVESLSTHYGLAENPDLLLARADLLYTQCRFQDALAMTSSVLDEDKYNFSIHPLHLACLYELKMTNALFLIAHDLADNHPEEPVTWFAVATYYFATDKVAEARRYFSKASMMDAHFAPAWIGFAHTFAAEGEHDQAISAYSTATRLFMGNHLPQVFLGMQHHAMNNMTVAEEFLKTAYELCKTDPLLLNEMGIVHYHQDRLPDAVKMFRGALAIVDQIDSDPQAWIAARTNLGQALRRLREFRPALEQFDEVLRLGGKDAAIFCAKGLIYLDLDRPDEAVRVLHEALAIHPQDPIATDLLNRALEETAGADLALFVSEEDQDQFDRQLQKRMMAAKARGGRAKGSGVQVLDRGKGMARGKGKGVSRTGYHNLGGGHDDDDDDDDRGGTMMEMADDE